MVSKYLTADAMMSWECMDGFALTALLRRPNLLITILRLVIRNQRLLLSTPLLGSIHEQLRVTRLIQTQEPERRRIDRLAYRQQAVVLKDNRFPVAEVGGDALPFLAVEHHAPELRVDGVRFVEAERVLRHHVELAAEDAEGFAVDGVRVARGVDIRAGFVDLACRHALAKVLCHPR